MSIKAIMLLLAFAGALCLTGCFATIGGTCWDDHQAMPCMQGKWECEQPEGDPCEICTCEPYDWDSSYSQQNMGGYWYY